MIKANVADAAHVDRTMWIALNYARVNPTMTSVQTLIHVTNDTDSEDE